MRSVSSLRTEAGGASSALPLPDPAGLWVLTVKFNIHLIPPGRGWGLGCLARKGHDTVF